ncbi:MAG: capsular biosynthesis protein [Cytophagia bacterium]|nr:MAG: capsular biosynthesis protein [Runella sp.]TAG25130.1 MAG: capsular biosynthesis protein [Cytophagales bacterium]TAG36981.1 MAG: capsular biosynthesis protein [Cytophagia bacterium]TAG51682.1 MAG: capsular biosynthesis protein [Runella slithyformis]TAG84574.1 MAG: capsular biosynthesis protein [Cytophagales bacterium]
MSLSFLKLARTYASSKAKKPILLVDTHAHVLPDLDNGPDTLEDSIALLREMAKKGVQKVVATPHVMGAFYRNSPESICQAHKLVVTELTRQGININLSVAAEYYLDVSFMASLENKAQLLPFDKRYLIFETSVVGLPPFLWDAVAQIKNLGLTPVLTHPERYYYLQQNFQDVLDLQEAGVLFQISLLSLNSPHPPTRLLVEQLIAENMVTFVGSNAHNQQEWASIDDLMNNKWYKMLMDSKKMLSDF